MSAITILTKAIEYDMSGRKLEALKLYEDGISELFKTCKAETNAEKKKHYQTKLLEYMKRAEEIKELVIKWTSKGEISDKIHIVEGSSGYSYHRIFKKYLTEDLAEVSVEEPYIREYHQICNLVMFCELLVSTCKKLKFIKVATIKDTRPESDQTNAFAVLKNSLAKHQIQIHFEYSEHMHDRQIILSNGYVIKIGRGLNYFKPATKFTIGAFDYNYRECRETNIDIFFCPENKK